MALILVVQAVQTRLAPYGRVAQLAIEQQDDVTTRKVVFELGMARELPNVDAVDPSIDPILYAECG